MRLRAGVDRVLRLRDPFDGADVTVTGADLAREGEDYVGTLAAGQEVLLARAGVRPDLAEAIARVRRSDLRPFGLTTPAEKGRG